MYLLRENGILYVYETVSTGPHSLIIILFHLLIIIKRVHCFHVIISEIIELDSDIRLATVEEELRDGDIWYCIETVGIWDSYEI
jgi:hypothetical protein